MARVEIPQRQTRAGENRRAVSCHRTGRGHEEALRDKLKPGDKRVWPPTYASSKRGRVSGFGSTIFSTLCERRLRRGAEDICTKHLPVTEFSASIGRSADVESGDKASNTAKPVGGTPPTGMSGLTAAPGAMSRGGRHMDPAWRGYTGHPSVVTDSTGRSAEAHRTSSFGLPRNPPCPLAHRLPRRSLGSAEMPSLSI